MSGRLDGKVVIVTGAGSIGPGWGNGKACAVLYAREGAKVVLVDRVEAAVAETAGIITAEGGEATPVVADVSTAEGVDAYVEAAVRRYGTVDVLHNNVGVGAIGPFTEVTEKQWDLVYRVNVKSVFLGSQRVIPVMRASGRGGSIVNISSVASMRWTGTAYAAYSSSKAAVNQLTQAIALEHAREGIRCNVVVVGYVDTPTVYVAQAAGPGEADTLRAARDAACPMGHVGSAWDVAYASLYLASDESRYVTGTQLVVDGGLTAGSAAAEAKN
ncbi:SDR family oxidoreductase [Dactylosporangium sp. NPDC051485]|uniref:SDR family NAD(P)-dependent oxidoreductase n=1 Tax=Dactylosporangium sp. NPDC051485 TaxID=3154846 RepID=UPI00343F72BE